MKMLNILLEISIYSSVLYFAIMFLKVCCKNRMSATLHFLVWGLLIVRLLIPITPESSIHLISIPDQRYNEPIADQSIKPYDKALNISRTFDLGQRRLQSKTAMISDHFESIESPQMELLSTEEILFSIWITGLVIGVLYMAVLYNTLYKCVHKSAVPPSKHLLLLLNEVKEELKIKRNIKIIGQCEYGTPAVLFPNTVLMPINTLVSMNDTEVKYMLRHELMHIKRNDPIIGLLLVILNIVYWFNPIVWIAFKQIRADMETACDVDVVHSFSRTEKNTYAAVLLSLFSKKQFGNLVLGMVYGNTKKAAEKRIRGVFMNRKSSKRVKIVSVLTTVLLLISCFTTACQPTPTKLIIQNKADDDLNKAILRTASPQAVPQSSVTQSPQSAKEHISDTATNQSKTVTIKVDADVLPIAMSRVPVAQVEEATISADEVGRIIQAFFGDAKLYSIVSTKDDIEAKILLMQKTLADDNALLNSDVALDPSGSNITDVNQLRKLMNNRIKELMELLPRAPSKKPSINGYDSAVTQTGLNACVELGEGQRGFVEASLSPLIGQMISLYAYGDDKPGAYKTLRYQLSTPIGLDSDAKIQQAKQKANQMIANMGIQGVTLSKVYLSKDNNRGDAISSDKQFYVFCYERVIGEGSVAFNFISNMYSPSKEENYNRVLPYETIQIWMEGDQCRQFTWKVPMRVTKMINENVELAIDSKKAVEIMKQQSFVQFVDAGQYFNNVEVAVSSIELELVRIKQRNKENYIVIPAWVFRGQINGAVTESALAQGLIDPKKAKADQYVAANTYFTHEENDTIMTINALDGTIINQSLGY